MYRVAATYPGIPKKVSHENASENFWRNKITLFLHFLLRHIFPIVPWTVQFLSKIPRQKSLRTSAPNFHEKCPGKWPKLWGKCLGSHPEVTTKSRVMFYHPSTFFPCAHIFLHLTTGRFSSPSDQSSNLTVVLVSRKNNQLLRIQIMNSSWSYRIGWYAILVSR